MKPSCLDLSCVSGERLAVWAGVQTGGFTQTEEAATVAIRGGELASTLDTAFENSPMPFHMTVQRQQGEKKVGKEWGGAP